MKQHHCYTVYILKCADGSYYTGVTNDMERRFQEHEKDIDAKCYTFSRRPLALVFAEPYQFVNEAIAREKQIKGWSRGKKEALIRGDIEELMRLAKNRVGKNVFLGNSD